MRFATYTSSRTSRSGSSFATRGSHRMCRSDPGSASRLPSVRAQGPHFHGRQAFGCRLGNYSDLARSLSLAKARVTSGHAAFRLVALRPVGNQQLYGERRHLAARGTRPEGEAGSYDGRTRELNPIRRLRSPGGCRGFRRTPSNARMSRREPDGWSRAPSTRYCRARKVPRS